MRNFKKEDIKKRFIDIEKSNLVSLEKIKKYKLNGITYDTKLTISIPGNPLSDGRVKFTTNPVTGMMHSYNPHKANLVKLFKEIYDSNEILHGICVLSPMIINIKFYINIPSKMKKSLKDKELELLKNEELACVYKKDNDNIEKIHYDTLQDFKYQIILRDEYVTQNNTMKFYVDDKDKERVDIEIIYGELPYWLENNMKTSTHYLKYSIGIKYKLINNISDDKWQKTFYKLIVQFYKNSPYKTSDKIVENVEFVLRNGYTKELIDLLDYSNYPKDKKISNILANVKKLLGGIKK